MRKFQGVRMMHRRAYKHPKVLLRRFREGARDTAGVNKGEAFTWRALTRAIPWGKLKGLQRVHAYVGDVLTELEDGSPSNAGVICVQLLKALHQVAIDGGAWTNATLYLPTPDPLTRRMHRGDDGEMEVISVYRKAQLDLSKAQKATQGDGGQDDEGTKPKGDGKGNKRD